MRYLTSACPEFHRIILVESGPRSVLESAIPRLRTVLGPQASFHLVTCYPGLPSALDPSATVWRTANHASGDDRARLLHQIKATGATAVAIICSGQPIMTRWKWWLAARLPMKVLVINENADCYWLDTAHLHNARSMALVRLGLSGEIAGRTILRLAVFPFGLFYLLLYASVVHVRRRLRHALSPRTREQT